MRFIKSIARKLRVAFKVLRSEGLLAFIILGVRFLEKMLMRLETKKIVSQKHLIDTKVKYKDALVADYTEPLPKWPGTSSKKLVFNWLMPPPGRGSGGHLNIFRFIKYLEDAGHMCRIYIYTQHHPGSVSDIRVLMGDSYPVLKAEMKWIEYGEEMDSADGIFATSWETAYASFNARSVSGRRFYFIQDFEPFFYPVGSLYTLAENTYRFGFYGITAGNWLATKLHTEYGMDTEYFDFGSDSSIYTLTNKNKRNEIFFYARPYTARRGFEMGIMALELFHDAHPDYTINLAGWDVSSYDIPFPYKNLRTLELDQLCELYNRCAAGLVMSMTNMSLLPLELLGCGTIPVVNDGDNNRLVSDNPYIAYAANNPKALADSLSAITTNPRALQHAEKAAESVKHNDWNLSGKKFLEVIEKETRRNV